MFELIWAAVGVMEAQQRKQEAMHHYMRERYPSARRVKCAYCQGEHAKKCCPNCGAPAEVPR